MNDAPIGIFDSGVGGLTVARAVLDQLPNEAVTYVGDTAHGPYGPLAIARVRQLSLDIMDGLVEQGVKMIVIACNTASAAMLRDARERYDIPVIEVIQPAVRRAVAATRNGRIGVIGTNATIGSGAYDDAFAAAVHLELFSAACPRFVEFVERGVTSSPELLELADEYLHEIRAAAVDTLVLGCTHYPMLTGVLSYVMGDDVTLVSSAEETAKDVYRVLVANDMERRSEQQPAHRFIETAPLGSQSPPQSALTAPGAEVDPSHSTFMSLARRFMGPEINVVAPTEVA